MKIRFLTLTLLTIFLVSVSRADDWRFGSMSIEWFDGYQKTPNDTAARFVGPNGEIVLVTAAGLRAGGDIEKVVKSYLAFGESELPQLSASKGRDVIQLRREDLAGSVTLFSTAAVQKKDKHKFYLQFFAVSRLGRCALITVEGHGDPTDEMKRFRPLFDTISWRENEKRG